MVGMRVVKHQQPQPPFCGTVFDRLKFPGVYLKTHLWRAFILVFKGVDFSNFLAGAGFAGKKASALVGVALSCKALYLVHLTLFQPQQLFNPFLDVSVEATRRVAPTVFLIIFPETGTEIIFTAVG